MTGSSVQVVEQWMEHRKKGPGTPIPPHFALLTLEQVPAEHVSILPGSQGMKGNLPTHWRKKIGKMQAERWFSVL